MTVEKVLKIYRAFIGPIICFLGLFGNIFVVLVLSKRRISRFNIYSIGIVSANTVAIIFNSILDDFFGRGLFYATKGRSFVKLDSLTGFSCKIMEYIPNVAYFCSSYILVIFALDRFVIMKWPFRYSSDGNVNKSICVCIIILLIGLLSAIPLAIKNELALTNSSYNYRNLTCQLSTNHSNLARIVIYYKSIVVFVIPTITVLILNLSLIYLILAMYKARKSLIVEDKSNRIEMNQLIGMIALSTYFLLFTIPLSVVIVIRLNCEINRPNTDPYLIEIRLLSKLLSSLKDICYSSNFLIYYIFVGYFKYELKRILRLSEINETILSFVSDKKPQDNANEMEQTKEPFI